jgi:thiol-disulfide isomerase/thioredoxin
MKFISILKHGHKFDELMKNGPALVKFFHPSCGHCIDMAPHWNSLKDKLKDHHHRNINIIEVHADTLKDIKSDCAKNIPGYPTIMEVLQHGKAGREHKGERNADALHNFFLKTFKESKHKMTGGGKKHKTVSKRKTISKRNTMGKRKSKRNTLGKRKSKRNIVGKRKSKRTNIRRH